MADSWEDEEVEAVVLKANWDDSGDELALEPRANWDDEEEEELDINVQKSTTTSKTTSPLPPKKKKSLAQKIAEREAEELAKKEEAAAKKRLDAQLASETPEQRKARENRMIIESDLENAKELFATMSVSAAPKKKEVNTFQESTPRTKLEFDAYVKYLMAKFTQFEPLAQYPYFVETLTRELCSSMSLDDTRKISTVISAQINEKQKAFSNKKKKGGAAKKAQLAKASSVETENYEIYEGEYDDFM